jgi:hydrocephalus-inducing protein
VQPLDSSCFSVQRLYLAGQVEGSKVAAGMEAIYKVTFKPESIDSYEQQLVVKTEREQFLVPLLAVGAAAALDLPDNITLPATPVHKPVRRSLLVSNVGNKADKFQLATSSSCFTVNPSYGRLAPYETLQLVLEFTPNTVGEHDAELEVVYEESGRATFTALKGSGVALPVGVSDSVVAFLPTYMSRLSHRSFKVVNGSDACIQFSIQAQPSAQSDLVASCAALMAVQRTAVPLTGTISLSTKDAIASAHGFKAVRAGLSTSRAAMQLENEQEQLHLNEGTSLQLSALAMNGTDELQADDELLLQDKQLAEVRHTKRARRAIATDKQLFSNPYFAVFPAEGAVNPHSELEVTVQFAPDSAQDCEATAWVQLQGVAERLPVKLTGQGLGAQVVFSYDVLDIGEAFVNTQHQYDVELLNKGKVEAQWSLQPCNTRFGSKFTFSPETGVLPAGARQNIRVQLLSDCLGRFSEAFQLQLKGSWTPLLLNIKGEVVGPQFTLDSKGVDFGIVSYGFR